MDNQNKDKDLDMSGISYISDATIREQPSQLNINTNGYLHSTFNYPLHSTVNFFNLSLDLSQTMAEDTDTLVDSKATMGSHNVNVIGGSTVTSDERSDHSRDQSSNAKTVVPSDGSVGANSKQQHSRDSAPQKANTNCQLDTVSKPANEDNTPRHCVNKRQLADQCVAVQTQQPLTQELLKTFNEKMRQTENWVERHDDLNWACDGQSDCDSSCLSFDVDDVSLSLDDTIAERRNISPRDTVPKHEQAPNDIRALTTITDAISNHLWGHSARLHDLKSDNAMISGTCDVCRLLRLKRQWGCTDLWSDSTDPPNNSQGSFQGHSTNAQALSFTDRLMTAHELLHDTIPSLKRSHPVGVSDHQSPKRRNTLSGSVTPSRAARLDKLRLNRPSSKRRSSKRSSRSVKQPVVEWNNDYEQPINISIHERLAPEGCDDKENYKPAIKQASCNSIKNRIECDSPAVMETPQKFKCENYKDADIALPRRKPSRTSKNANKVRKTMGECFGGSVRNAVVQDTCTLTSQQKEKHQIVMAPTPLSKKTLTPTSFRSYSGLPIPDSPWTTDKKELKRKLKRMSRSLKYDKENIQLQPLGCI